MNYDEYLNKYSDGIDAKPITDEDIHSDKNYEGGSNSGTIQKLLTRAQSRLKEKLRVFIAAFKMVKSMLV